MSDAMYLAFRGTNMSGVHHRTNSDSGSSTLSSPEPKADREQREAFLASTMSIKLDNHYKAKVYSTGEAVSGILDITTHRTVPFDFVSILLVGTAFTSGDNLSLAPMAATYDGSNMAFQIFLKLEMPVPDDMYPSPRVLQPGTTYSIPFNFVIPKHLTVGACRHKVDSPAVHEHHVRLPPTMGYTGGVIASAVTSNNSARWEHDDLTPEMARVEYTIKARVYRRNDSPGKPSIKIMEDVKHIRVLPTSIEDPPLTLSSTKDSLYKIHASKTLRKGIMPSLPILRNANAKIGRLLASSQGQPVPILISHDGRTASPTQSTIQLHFEPATPEALPPRVISVSAKLVAHTFFSGGSAMPNFPNLGSPARPGMPTDRRSSYYTGVNILSNQPVGDHAWQSHVAALRRDSGYCSTNESDNEEHECSGRHRETSDVHLHYDSELVVPIQLPANKKTFLPTFHSCIVSRVYVLHVSVTVSPQGSSSSVGSISSASNSGRRPSSGNIGSIFSQAPRSSQSSQSDDSNKRPSATILSQMNERRGSSGSINGASSPSSSRRGSLFNIGENSGNTTISLDIPVQVAVVDEKGQTMPAPDAGLPSFEAALEEAEADAHLVPRVMGTVSSPTQAAQQHQEDDLPGYFVR